MEGEADKQHRQIFGESPPPEETKTTRVAELARKLEKSLDINHFLNIRFHRQNRVLYEKLCQEREAKDGRRRE